MNKIKVSLDYNTITVKQYVDFVLNEGNEVGQVSAILGQSKDFVRQLAPDQMQNAINAFKSVIDEPQANKQNRWKDYGFVPDINAISFGEWLDLDSNCKDFPKNLNKILSILYRPISNQLGNKYGIEPYNASHLKNADDFNEMPLSIANGALVFFDYRKRIGEHFASVFGFTSDDELEGGDDDDGGGIATSELSNKYGWFHVIEELADRDVTKFDAITNTQASTIFAHLSYRIDYFNFQKQLLSKNNH